MSEKYPPIHFRLVERREPKWLLGFFATSIYEIKIGDSPSKLVTFKELAREVGSGNNDLYSCDMEANRLYDSGQYELWVNYPGGGSRKIN